MRAAAPVRATMPSALVSSVTSSPAMLTTNQMKPPASTISAVIPVAMVRKPIHRAKPANILVDHFKGVVDGVPRRQGSHPCNERDLCEYGGISDKANRE